MGSTLSDVVVLPLWDVISLARLDPAVLLYCVKKTHCPCENWLNPKRDISWGIGVYVDEFACVCVCEFCVYVSLPI